MCTFCLYGLKECNCSFHLCFSCFNWFSYCRGNYLCGPRKCSCQTFCGPEGRFYCSNSVCSLWPAPFSYLCMRVRILCAENYLQLSKNLIAAIRLLWSPFYWLRCLCPVLWPLHTITKEWPMCNWAITVSSFLFVQGQTVHSFNIGNIKFIFQELIPLRVRLPQRDFRSERIPLHTNLLQRWKKWHTVWVALQSCHWQVERFVHCLGVPLAAIKRHSWNKVTISHEPTMRFQSDYIVSCLNWKYQPMHFLWARFDLDASKLSSTSQVTKPDSVSINVILVLLLQC